MFKLHSSPRSLIVRLIVFTAVLIMSVLFGFVTHITKEQSRMLTKEIIRGAMQTADSVSASLASYIVVRDYTSIETVLMQTMANPHIDNIQVADAKGRILGDVARLGDEVRVRFEQVNLKIPHGSSKQVDTADGVMLVRQPVLLGGTVGWVCIAFDVRYIEKQTRDIRNNNLLKGLIVSLLAGLAVYLFLRRPIKAIAAYTEFADLLDSKQGEQVDVCNDSVELFRLGNALNRTSKSLRVKTDMLNTIAAIAENSPDVILSIDKNGEVKYANSSAQKLLAEIFGEDASMELLLPAEIKRILKNCCSGKSIQDLETNQFGRTLIWKFTPFERQQVLHCHVLDITGRRNTELALASSEIRYRTLFDTAHDAIFMVHGGRILDCNSHAAKMLGYSVDELLRMESWTLFPQTQADGSRSMDFIYAFFDKAFKGQPQSFECKMKRSDGVLIETEASLHCTDSDGHRLVMAIVRDISDRKEAEQKLIQQANFDMLTGLPNRVLAMDRLQQSILRAHRENRQVGLLFVDVDWFKKVNDSVGHAAGDQLLVDVANRLLECVREGDTVARLGGDEFVIILNDVRKMVDCEVVVEKVLRNLTDPFVLDGQEFFLSASIGIAGYPADGDSGQILLRNADAAMYQAKQNGRNTFYFYTSEINELARNRIRMESHLRRALDNGEFYLAYQPQINVRDNCLAGAEALIRWQNPQLGLVRPDQFISLAEDTGLIVPIGEWVIHTACQAGEKWRRQLNGDFRISVNISQRQFRDYQLLNTVKYALRKTGLPARSLELEITESLLLNKTGKTLAIIEALKEIGVTLALDDFGTGYSSLAYLKQYPFDVLKIDRSFVRDINVDREDESLCEAILAIAYNLGLVVVGEGVENHQQLVFLRERGTDLVQGYYFSKPLTESEFDEYLLRINDSTEQAEPDNDTSAVCYSNSSSGGSPS